VGRPCSLLYATLDTAGKASQEMRTVFMQEIVRRGILAPSFIHSYSHSPADIDYTLDVVGEALQVYRNALRDGPARYLEGRPLKPVFRNRA
jgi:glutamate-1-semialdehyde 2,1-aminomutase